MFVNGARLRALDNENICPQKRDSLGSKVASFPPPYCLDNVPQCYFRRTMSQWIRVKFCLYNPGSFPSVIPFSPPPHQPKPDSAPKEEDCNSFLPLPECPSQHSNPDSASCGVRAQTLFLKGLTPGNPSFTLRFIYCNAKRDHSGPLA